MDLEKRKKCYSSSKMWNDIELGNQICGRIFRVLER